MKLSLKIALIIFQGIVLSLAFTFLLTPFIENVSLLVKMAVVLILVVIPISFIIWLLIYFLVISPIILINDLAKIIATGNLSQRIQIKAVDEIGELSQNFNKVINNLASGLQNMANSLRDEKMKEIELAKNIQIINKEKAKDEALLTSIGDAVIAIDDNYKITVFNQAAVDMIGTTKEEVINQPYNLVLKFLGEKDNTPVADFISQALHGIKPSNESRLVLRKKDDELVPILQSTSPIFDNSRNITGVVVALRDITKERELEKLKDEFVSLASHELRTPMTAIKGLISMIFEGDYGEINESLKEPLGDVATSTDRLIQLVNDILDVSRIEAGRTRFNIIDLQLSDLAAEIIQMFKPLTSKKNINLEIVGSVPLKVSADSDKVKQILINLINNALKFTDKGSITIAFRSDDQFAYISVVDSGIGISKEDQQKLFSKFTQVSSSQLGRPVGTGLGLYISKEFAIKMGGDLWIARSEPNMGTTFTFTLPLSNTDIAAEVAKKLTPATI